MSQTAVSKVVVKAIFDAKYREKLAKNPAEAIKMARARLTPAEAKAIGSLKLNDWDAMTLKDINNRLGSVMAGTYKTITYTTK